MRAPSNFQHVVITGASSGIGAALARHYAATGARMSLLGRDAGRLQEVATQCEAVGAPTASQTGDVTDAAFMSRWLANCDDQARVDLIIANAGVGGQLAMASPAGETLAATHEILSVNILGVANAVLPLLPRFVERRRGHLVLVSSLAGYLGLPDAPAYSASKAAVRVYGNALHRLLMPHGVKVSVVCPGFVKTPMSESLPGKQPFLWSPEQAAHHIAIKISQGKHEIAFPWQLAMLSRIATMLPSFVLDPLLHRTRHNREYP
jgi:short-subunit dehydrogenase